MIEKTTFVMDVRKIDEPSPGLDRILVAEDDPVSALVLKRSLENRGYTVMAVRNGAEALSAWENESYRIVITDWMMPTMDGLELCRRIRQREAGRYTHVVILTARCQNEDRAECLQAGIDDYLLKPLNISELDALLRVARHRLSTRDRLDQLKLDAA